MASSALRNGFRRLGLRCFQAPASKVPATQLVVGAGVAQVLLGGSAFGVHCLSQKAEKAKDTKHSHDGDANSVGANALPQHDDGLWHEARLDTWDEHTSTEVLELLAHIERWHGLFPFCTHSSRLRDYGNGCVHYRVHFGIRVGLLYVGDLVEYEVRQSAGAIRLTSVNNKELEYADHIEYNFFVQDAQKGGTDIKVRLRLHARNRMYLTVWKTMETQLFYLIANALKMRLKAQDSICLQS